MKYRWLVTGKYASGLSEYLFLLDESLVPAVAKALCLVGHNIRNVAQALGGQGVKDPEIIDWCRQNNAIWVHADHRARKEHKHLLQTSGICTLCIYRKGGQMTGKEQLRILAFVIPKVIESIGNQPKKRHFRASAANSSATPALRKFDI